MAELIGAALQAQVEALQAQVARLEREKTDLQLLLEMTTEHSDNIAEELQSEIQQRQRVEAALRQSNAQLSKHSAQLEAITRVGQQVTCILDLTELLPQVARAIQATFDYYFVGIWVLNVSNDQLVLQAYIVRPGFQLPTPLPVIPLDAPHSIILAAFRSGEIYLANDVTIDPMYLAWEGLPDTRSELALPLQFGADRIGALDIQSEQAAAFSPQDVSGLRILADQIAIAMRNASLYDRVTQFNERLEQTVQERTEELAKAYRTLAKMDKSKSDFIDIAAHELRTPLTLIAGYTGILETITDAPPDIQLMVKGIQEGQNRLLEIVNSMLDVSKIDNQVMELRREPVDLHAILTAIRAKVNSALKERRLTLTVADSNLPLVLLDRDQMSKLFYHLIVNAIKYTPDGGSINVTGRTITNPRSDIAEPIAIEITVQDTGIGIDADYHELVFEKFFQTGQAQFHSSGKTKFKGGGPGLGLTIARGIVRAHGGRIWVESPGHDEATCPGSTFHVLLPIAN
jgi:signal transduction histidine kinase